MVTALPLLNLICSRTDASIYENPIGDKRKRFSLFIKIYKYIKTSGELSYLRLKRDWQQEFLVCWILFYCNKNNLKISTFEQI